MDAAALDNLLDTLSRDRRPTFPRLNREAIEAAVAQLDQGDLRRRRLVGQLLLHQGRRSLAALLAAAANAPLPIRRSAVFLLGRQAARLDDGTQRRAATACLLQALAHDDAKLRKNSAVVLGPWIPEAVPALAAALKRESVDWIRPSLLLALGAVGGDQARAALLEWQPTGAEESGALAKALDRTAPPPTLRSLKRPLETAVAVELITRPGLEPQLVDELRQRLGLAARSLGPGGLALETADIHQLLTLRTLAEVLLPLASGPRAADQMPALIERLGQPSLGQRLLTWHKPGDGPLPYRLEVRGPGLGHHRRRALVQQWVAALQQTTPLLVNSPSHYAVELRLILRPDSFRLLARPSTLPDERFSYRRADVPAALDPVVAAGLVRALGPTAPQARVLDPCCGSGTLLFERGLLAPYGQLVGIDIAPRAVEAARNNAQAAGLAHTAFSQGDAAALNGQGPFDELVANLPFGLRSGDHTSNQTLYTALFRQLPKLLVPGARILLYTQEQKLTHRLFARSKSLRLSRTFRVDAGGLQPTAFLARRR
ncbi:MAG: methyltransferase domain-containing protein [Candidatus Latescibacteria bacterium]|nr:methyltransferase domain-containing protein [Candidatus Latescibacterota bacterium]